jgi:hypothetical protein
MSEHVSQEEESPSTMPELLLVPREFVWCVLCDKTGRYYNIQTVLSHRVRFWQGSPPGLRPSRAQRWQSVGVKLAWVIRSFLVVLRPIARWSMEGFSLLCQFFQSLMTFLELSYCIPFIMGHTCLHTSIHMGDSRAVASSIIPNLT